MINPGMLNSIKAIIIDPAWQGIIVARLEMILKHADKKWHESSTPDNFKELKGRYDQAKEIYDLFKDGSNLANDGIVQMSQRA